MLPPFQSGTQRHSHAAQLSAIVKPRARWLWFCSVQSQASNGRTANRPGRSLRLRALMRCSLARVRKMLAEGTIALSCLLLWDEQVHWGCLHAQSHCAYLAERATNTSPCHRVLSPPTNHTNTQRERERHRQPCLTHSASYPAPTTPSVGASTAPTQTPNSVSPSQSSVSKLPAPRTRQRDSRSGAPRCGSPT